MSKNLLIKYFSVYLGIVFTSYVYYNRNINKNECKTTYTNLLDCFQKNEYYISNCKNEIDVYFKCLEKNLIH